MISGESPLLSAISMLAPFSSSSLTTPACPFRRSRREQLWDSVVLVFYCWLSPNCKMAPSLPPRVLAGMRRAVECSRPIDKLSLSDMLASNPHFREHHGAGKLPSQRRVVACLLEPLHQGGFEAIRREPAGSQFLPELLHVHARDGCGAVRYGP